MLSVTDIYTAVSAWLRWVEHDQIKVAQYHRHHRGETIKYEAGKNESVQWWFLMISAPKEL